MNTNADRARFLCGTNDQSVYTDAEAEWLRVLLRWKQRTARLLPTAAELLGLLERLGYVRAAGSLAPAELERALSEYRERTGKRFPTYTEILALLLAEGYQLPEGERMGAFQQDGSFPVPAAADDALRYDLGCAACTGCGDLTVSCYHGRPCCPNCYPERRATFLAQQATTWQREEITPRDGQTLCRIAEDPEAATGRLNRVPQKVPEEPAR